MKRLPAKTRWALLAALLAATSAAVYFAPAENDTPAPVEARRKTPRDEHRGETARPMAASLRLDKLKRPPVEEQEDTTAIFQAKSWYVPPPPPKPAPPPPPSPPPLPFSYMGRLVEDGKPVIFLSKQDRSFVVKEGDIVEGNYRVEKIQPQAMTLTYLPLNMQQTLPVGASN